MQKKAIKGTIYGADFSKKEKKAMEMEIRKQIAEYDSKNTREIDAMILWVLHERFGFGPKRLRDFYENFNLELFKLIDRYEMESCDDLWLFEKKLEEIGVDLNEFSRNRKD